ncbi:hypothetical protein CS390_05875 [Pseudomonas sp. HLS-6]|uniref:hypothetical protein n=1 Tax=Pseudomonas sp. HLS-6 TaxID=2049589 RepID=UPI000C17F48F|nr:hypothetical protein [Pseudomonas sp. HLS-6]ATR82119.1 hypothetical protein CS390_05875 [Pseudomonas sp. HLS-6]
MDIAGFDYKDFLPYYLTDDQKRGLASAMKDFSGRSNIFTQEFQAEVFQGDCWEGIPHITLSGRKENIQAIILSNTCDIDKTNVRHTPVHVTYAPLIGLAAYEKLLLAALPEKDVKGKIAAIKAQHMTNLIYLPASVEGTLESVAMLDMVSSIPYKAFEAQAEKRKVRSLNQLGFYLLSFKLSIHFCRMHEAVYRG